MSDIRLRARSNLPSPSTAAVGRNPSGESLQQRRERRRASGAAAELWSSWNNMPTTTTTATPTTTLDHQQARDESSSAADDVSNSSNRRRQGGATGTLTGVKDPLAPLHIIQPRGYQHQEQQQPRRQESGDDDGLLQQQYDNMGKIRTGKRLRAEKTRLEDYHIAYRTALHVPDNAYRAYLQGRTGKSRKNLALVSKVCCLNTCIGFSMVAVIFLCFIGFLINAQPVLMTGTLEYRRIETSDGSGKFSNRYIIPRHGDMQPAARAAYRAALAYFFCILICIYALNPTRIQSQLYRFRNNYQDIPDHASSADSTLPQFHNPNGHDALTPPSFIQAIWNRCNYVVRQRLAEMGYYHPNTRRKGNKKTG